jgi:hypothetical protein
MAMPENDHLRIGESSAYAWQQVIMTIPVQHKVEAIYQIAPPTTVAVGQAYRHAGDIQTTFQG